MGFIFFLMVVLGFDVGILLYLVMSEFFNPYTTTGQVDVWNVSIFIGMLSLAGGVFISLLTYGIEKLLYCGKSEYPRPSRAIRFGVMSMLSLMIGIFLHVFHFLNIGVMLLLFTVVIIGFVLVR